MSLLPPLDFPCPVGAEADLKELEYVSALHQTAQQLRQDGSISAKDVVRYLVSRHGICVTKREVESTILKGLGGGDEEDECIDLSEVTAILMIPFLCKTAAAEKNGESTSPTLSHSDFGNVRDYEIYERQQMLAKELTQSNSSDIVEHVLNMLLDNTGVGSKRQKPVIDHALIRTILNNIQERELAEDEALIDAMVMDATGGDKNNEIKLNGESFLRALTSDVGLYDTTNEISNTTFYQDVFGDKGFNNSATSASLTSSVAANGERTYSFTHELSVISSGNNFDLEGNQQEHDPPRTSVRGRDETSNSNPLAKMTFTAAGIDYAADTYRSKSFVVSIWICYILIYYAYAFAVTTADKIECTPDVIDFGCLVANGIINWLYIGAHLM
jgi:hypothetical protein